LPITVSFSVLVRDCVVLSKVSSLVAITFVSIPILTAFFGSESFGHLSTFTPVPASILNVESSELILPSSTEDWFLVVAIVISSSFPPIS
jgi:hypothetical protein